MHSCKEIEHGKWGDGEGICNRESTVEEEDMSSERNIRRLDQLFGPVWVVLGIEPNDFSDHRFLCTDAPAQCALDTHQFNYMSRSTKKNGGEPPPKVPMKSKSVNRPDFLICSLPPLPRVPFAPPHHPPIFTPCFPNLHMLSLPLIHPESKSNTAESEIDDIFSAVPQKKEKKKAELKARQSRVHKKLEREEQKLKKAEDDAFWGDSRGKNSSARFLIYSARWLTENRYTEEGYKIYTKEELKIGLGGDTDLCPFDCDCWYFLSTSGVD